METVRETDKRNENRKEEEEEKAQQEEFSQEGRFLGMSQSVQLAITTHHRLDGL